MSEVLEYDATIDNFCINTYAKNWNVVLEIVNNDTNEILCTYTNDTTDALKIMKSLKLAIKHATEQEEVERAYE